MEENKIFSAIEQLSEKYSINLSEDDFDSIYEECLLAKSEPELHMLIKNSIYFKNTYIPFEHFETEFINFLDLETNFDDRVFNLVNPMDSSKYIDYKIYIEGLYDAYNDLESPIPLKQFFKNERIVTIL